ncbi:MAG TPA: hypothetical protein PKD55_21140 [Bellilinea sp.]|mgnify:CR=1 FL=1|nr:hypothetical protein [Bellilinea sp.]
MDESTDPTIWLIDENERELGLHKNILQNAFVEYKTAIRVEAVLARQSMGDYHDLLNDSRTVAIIVDQRLNEIRGIDHTGIELTKRLRSLAPKLPIYILTNYAQSDDFLGNEWTVEDIIPKEDMHDPDTLKTIIARLLRRIDVHQSIMESREARFRDLLKKSLTEALTADEQAELSNLQLDRTAVIISNETSKLQRLEQALVSLKNLTGLLDE